MTYLPFFHYRFQSLLLLRAFLDLIHGWICDFPRGRLIQRLPCLSSARLGYDEPCDIVVSASRSQYRVYRRSPVRLSAPISTRSCRSRVVVARDVPVMAM